MDSFIDFLKDEATLGFHQLDEKALELGGSSTPKYNQILILGGGAGCFAGDTLVKTHNGYSFIKDIKEGDVVSTFNETTKEYEWKSVQKLNVFVPTKRMIKLTTDTGETIVCTEDHEFYVDGSWVQAKDL